MIDYKLADVPELGYFRTDKPYPRGELLVKAEKFMAGYYKRPELTAERFDEEGFYRTGDVMAEIEPDHLVFVDRCNNVIKLSQGEFVAVSKLEALYSQSNLIHQIYIYGTSERSYLLAVVVPTEQATGNGGTTEQTKSAIRHSMYRIAEEQGLNGYELPRDFIIETEPFSHKNGLLSGIGKHLRPKLKERYGEPLEQLYARIAQDQVEELRALRAEGADRPVMETLTRALSATLGVAAADIRPADRFIDLGGDSLTALEFSKLLTDIFGIEVPVSTIINPAGNVQALARHIETERNSGIQRATFAGVHGADATRVSASELRLEKFIDGDTLAGAVSLPRSADVNQTVLLTGATGYLGRFLALSWLERLAETGGRLVLLARGADAAEARQRIEGALDTDPDLMAHFRRLAAEHLEVVPAELGAPGLGLDTAIWDRLADSVDVIVHAAAHVNHVLPYNQLFPANVAGTAELIRLALTGTLKRFHYVSTLGVSALAGGLVDEDGDIRETVPSCDISDGYANGYNISKWASEVLLRQANELYNLPVDIFRPGMILAHNRYTGQLNVPDMFTRLLFSLVATGVAPATFYARDLSEGRPRARYEGFTVDFLADVITAIGARDTEGFHTYNLASPHEDDISLDTFVDWLIESGCAIQRLGDYDDWLSRFETAMHALPEDQRQQSLLALLGPYRQPQVADPDSRLPTDRFRAASEAAGYNIPHLSAQLIDKYVADLQHLGVLPSVKIEGRRGVTEVAGVGG